MLCLPFCQSTTGIDLRNISQIFSFEDDSLEILFKDQSILQLSPCGANFRYTRPRGRNQPSLAKNINEICQRCVFATSETRSKVVQGILIRNQLSTCPYLPEDLLKNMSVESFRFHRELQTYDWPQNKFANKQVKCNIDGSITVHSDDSFAQLDLFRDGHRVRVSFVVPLSSDKSYRVESNEDIQNNIRNMYAWQHCIFPALNCPTEWRYPLQLALNAKYGTDDGNTKLADHRSPAITSVPRKCENQFTHRWRNVVSCTLENDTHKDSFCETNFQETHFSPGHSFIKFMWCENASYWMTSKLNDPHPKIEVWLKDGSVFKSHPTNDRYFIHVYPSLMDNNSSSKEDLYTNGKFVEKIVSSASVPTQNSSIKSVMLRCIRMLMYRQEEVVHLSGIANEVPCWKLNETNTTSSVARDTDTEKCINEKIYILGVGKFSVADDSIQIAFDDCSILHMTINIKLIRETGQHYSEVFTPGQCRIMLATGKYFIIDNVNSVKKEAEQYMKHAAAWIEWLSKPLAERTQSPFYSDTIHNAEKIDMVSEELAKINRLTLSDTPQYLELSEQHSAGKKENFTECSNHRDVSNALSLTSRAICDLDDLINSYRNGS